MRFLFGLSMSKSVRTISSILIALLPERVAQPVGSILFLCHLDEVLEAIK
jgi:hypothetical protein